jgi:hypothetical protein
LAKYFPVGWAYGDSEVLSHEKFHFTQFENRQLFPVDQFIDHDEFCKSGSSGAGQKRRLHFKWSVPTGGAFPGEMPVTSDPINGRWRVSKKY